MFTQYNDTNWLLDKLELPTLVELVYQYHIYIILIIRVLPLQKMFTQNYYRLLKLSN